MCEVEGCENRAEYERWFKKRDGFGIPTGLVQRRKVCGECAFEIRAADARESGETARRGEIAS